LEEALDLSFDRLLMVMMMMMIYMGLFAFRTLKQIRGKPVICNVIIVTKADLRVQ